jgi:hypothetical protein
MWCLVKRWQRHHQYSPSSPAQGGADVVFSLLAGRLAAQKFDDFYDYLP